MTPGADRKISLSYRIDEGSQSYVERVEISGNSRTKDKVIRRELALGPGDVYNSVLAEASKQRLKNRTHNRDAGNSPCCPISPGLTL